MYKSPRCFLPSFKSIGLFVQEKKRKIDFQDGGHGGNLGLSIGSILVLYDLQGYSPGPHASKRSFKSVGFSVQEKKQKHTFLRLRPWQPSCISDRNNFSYILSTRHPDASYQVSSQLAFRFRRRAKKKDFKDGGHLEFLFGRKLLLSFFLLIFLFIYLFFTLFFFFFFFFFFM